MLGSSSMIRTFTNLCFSFERQENRKTSSLADVALDRDGSLMRFNNVLHERQPQATSLHIMDQPVTHTIKLLENLCLFSTRNSDAFICDFDREIRSAPLRRDRELLHLA